MLRLLKLIVLFFLFAFSACSQSPTVTSAGTPPSPFASPTLLPSTATQTVVPSPFHGGTYVATITGPELATRVALATVTLTTTPSPTPPPTLTAASMPPDFSPILYGKKYDANTFFVLLGSVAPGEWLSPDQAFARFAGAWEYDTYSFAGKEARIHGQAPESSRINQDYFVGTDVTYFEFGMVGVAQGWQVTQRRPDELSSETEFYRQVVIDWLSQAGVVSPQIAAIQIYRIDLEDDGSDEIFITSTLVESQHTVKAGDHSIILMRKVSGKDAVTIPILADLYRSLGHGNPFPCTYSIGNFIDLNQDGVLDVVVEFQRWEGFGAAVYQVAGQKVEEVLGNTCITP
jgi:hypothetical protein